jgi:hypothetical protein
VRGGVQRLPAILRARGDLRAAVDQPADHLELAAARRRVDGLPSVLGGSAQVEARVPGLGVRGSGFGVRG